MTHEQYSARRERADEDGKADTKGAGQTGHLRRYECLLGVACRIWGIADDAHYAAGGAGEHRRDGEDGRRGDRPSAEHGDCSGGGDRGEWDQSDCRGDQMANQQLTAFDRQAVGAVGLVDLLRQRFHRLETEQEEHQCRGDQRGRRAAHDHRLEQTGHRREHSHSQQTGRRKARQAGDTAAGYRRRDPSGHRYPRFAPSLLLVQLAAQQDHGAQILHGHREPQLGNEAAASGKRVE